MSFMTDLKYLRDLYFSQLNALMWKLRYEDYKTEDRFNDMFPILAAEYDRLHIKRIEHYTAQTQGIEMHPLHTPKRQLEFLDEQYEHFAFGRFKAFSRSSPPRRGIPVSSTMMTGCGGYSMPSALILPGE